MDAFAFKVIHLAGVIGLFTALGSIITSGKDGKNKLGGILHGISLILIFIGGFGMIGMLKYGFPWWVIVKLVIWLAMGAMLSVGKRELLPRPATFGIVLALGIAAAYLGIYGKWI